MRVLGLLIPFLAASWVDSSEAACDCEVECAKLLAAQRQENARLRSELRALRDSTVTAAARRTDSLEPPSCDDDWTIASDEEAEALQGCRTVGQLEIQAGVTTLASLQSLEEAKGISIRDNEDLSSLAGLENLRVVRGTLDIRDNSALLSLLGLQGLQEATLINIYENDLLTSLAGLGNLSNVEDKLDIYQNANLFSLEGLDSLQSVGTLDIDENNQLTSLLGLENLQTVSKELDIKDNEQLASLTGLEGLRSAETLVIYNNDQLVSLTGLENLEVVNVLLDISRNDQFVSLAGLQGLRTAESIDIDNNDLLASLAGLENLELVNNKFQIRNNEQLISLTALASLTAVKGELSIRDNSVLTSLVGLEGLHSAKNVDIRDNDQLLSLVGLDYLEVVTGEFDIRDNAGLTSLAGLGGLHTAGNITIYENDMLVSLTGLENLVTVGYLDIYMNANLVSLSGLQSLQTADRFDIWYHDKLESCAGVNSLTSVGTLDVFRNDGLLSLAGLESLHNVEKLDVDGNPNLLSLQGLEGLRNAETIWVDDCPRLGSLVALAGITSADEILIHDLPDLVSLSGLENLESVRTRLSIQDNKNLTSLAGLYSLRSAAWIRISRNAKLESLVGLFSLQVVHYLLDVDGNTALRSLGGLESLTQVGALSLYYLPLLESLAGLPSFTHAYGGISIARCALSSLLGLGSLLRAGQLQVQHPWEGTRMQFLGGPLAAGARVDVINIDEKAWPYCVTPHERMALVSAAGSLNSSSIPDSTWQRWETLCKRELYEPFNCTKGHPCNITLDGEEETVFISGRTTGCGFCSEGRLRTDVVDGVLDLGYALSDEETGPLSICRCGAVSGPVAELHLQGPRQSGTTVCSRGHDCWLSLDGELEPTDRVVLMSGSCDGDPDLGYTANSTAENTYVMDGSGEWYSAPPTSYQVCWRAPCTTSPDGPTCSAPEDRYFQVGEVQLLGPYPRNYMLVLGEFLSAANIGLGVSDGDRMHLRRSCGEENEEGDSVLATSSTGLLFDFGRLTEERVKAGVHRLCWCQERDDLKCDTMEHFLSESGEVRVLCPDGQQFVSSGHCEACPAGTERREPGLEPCEECPVGQFSRGGRDSCGNCDDGTYTNQVGSSACVACPPWESANADSTGCVFNSERIVLLVLFFLAVGAFFVILVRSIRRRPYVIDVSLDEGHTFITTLGPHGFVNLYSTSFPVTLSCTGHPGLDAPRVPLRATVQDSARLELLTQEGNPIKDRLDTSMGRLAVAFPHDLLHQRRPLPPALALPVFLMASVALFIAAGEGMMLEALIIAAAVALVCAAGTALLYRRPRGTPLTKRLKAFKRKLPKNTSKHRCEKGPKRAIAIGKLYELLDFFRDFIQDRTAYYLDSNILRQLTKQKKVSFAELVGPGRVEWFVSHFWGTSFEHFCMALRKHAESVCGERDWRTLHYWVCFCSNNQYQIQEELGDTWAESSFYITLRSGFCQGTCMVLDDQALPLTRIWCIFELLQTVKLERSAQGFQGLLLCTSGGVLNEGSGSVEVAMALAGKVAQMDLEEAQATNPKDATMIREQVVKEMGSYDALNDFVCQEVYEMIENAQRNSNQRFVTVLRQLRESIDRVEV